MANTTNSFSYNADTGIISIATPDGIHEMRFQAATDVLDLSGAGVPTDGTTGANAAGKGSRYTDTTNGKLYINGGAGTKASPVWKLVTSAT